MLLIFWVSNWIMFAGKNEKNENPPLSKDRRRKRKEGKEELGSWVGWEVSKGKS